MRLTRLDVAALPGLDRGFSLEPGPGVNLVIGPNTAGKTSLVRAVHSLLWPDAVAGAPRMRLAAALTVDGRALVARRGAEGSVTWERDGQAVAPPPLPSGHLRDRYELGLLDLVARDRRGESFAAEVRRQMTGGVDLDLTGAMVFPRSASLTGKLQAALVKAEAELRDLEHRLHRLHEREKGLDRLQTELDEAAAAHREADAIRAALAALAAATDLERAEAVLADFPAAQASFREDDPETLRALAERLRQDDETITAAAARLATAERELATLPAAAAGAPDPAAVEPLVEAWAAAAHGREAAALALESARARLAQITSRLEGVTVSGAEAEAPGRVAVADLGRLFVEMESARARRQSADLLLRDPTLAGDDGDASEAALRSVLGALDRWLASPERAALWPLVTTAASLTVVVLVAWPTAHPAALVAGLVASAGALAWTVGTLRGARAESRHAAAARAALTAAGFTEPVPDRQAGAALRERVRQALGRRETAIVWLEQLRAVARQAAGDEEAARVAGVALLASGGLGRELSAAGVLHDAPLVAAALEAEAEVARCAAAAESQESAAVARAERAQAALRDCGVADDRCADPAAATGALRIWRERLQRRARVQADLEREREAVAAAQRRRQVTDEELHRLRARLDLSADGATDDGLRRLADRHAAWQLAVARRDETRALLAARQAAVAPGLASTCEAELNERLAAALERGAREPLLRQEHSDLAAELKQAREGRAYEEALAARDRQREELAADRDRARRAALADAVLADLRNRTADTRPRVLERAAAHLRGFTRGAHRLELVGGAGATPAFAATDARTNERQSLEELSDGTRAQLLLAVRLAFIETLEDGQPLPLFLDEALTTTDDERFDAIAGAVGLLAREQQRQVFYLTSQPGDVLAWQRALAARGLPAAIVLDLAAARNLAAAARPDQLPPPASTPTPPAPTTPLAPQHGRDGQHVAWLLLDDALEQSLAAARVHRVGTALAVRDELVAGGVLDERSASLLEERAEWLGLFCDYRQIGRGRSVTVVDIDDSLAISPTMRPRVLTVLTATGGEPRAFAAELDGVEGLQRRIATRLREHLLERGVLPDREPLDEPTLLIKLLAELGRRADLKETGKPDAERVAACVSRWWRAAGAALASPPGAES